MLGGLVWIVIWAYWASVPTAAVGEVKPGGELFDALAVISVILVLIGLTGAHYLQTERTRIAGATSIVLPWVGVAMMGIWIVGLVDSYLLFIGGVLMLLIGLGMFCIVSIRARMLPRSAIVPLVIGLLLFPLMNPDDWRALMALPLGAAWIWLGYAVWHLATQDPGGSAMQIE